MTMDGCLNITCAGEALTLMPQRAVGWCDQRTVFVADTHIGKDDRFRRAGIPVPAAVACADFERLTQCVALCRAERLVVLGDLLHARLHEQDACVPALERWRAAHRSLEVVVVRGNHDVHAGPPAAMLNFTMVDEPFELGPFTLRHHPVDTEAVRAAEGFVLAGHVHPGVRVNWAGHHTGRFPCFHVDGAQMVLPAFGRFTGLATIRGGQCYAVAGRSVMDVTPLAFSR